MSETEQATEQVSVETDEFASVHRDKLAALEDARETGRLFFSTSMIEEVRKGKFERVPLYVVAKSELRANHILSKFVMPLMKWPQRKQNDEYLSSLKAALDAATADSNQE